jgi:hypothetical protein
VRLLRYVSCWFFSVCSCSFPNADFGLNPEHPPLVKLEPYEAWPISTAARFHLLPESYLYGLIDVKLTANYYTSYLLGKVYAHGAWFYFPIAFLIKSTVGVLVLSLLTLGVIATRRLNQWRESCFSLCRWSSI